MKTDICCIFNLAPHYRAPIYSLLDRELNCDFYIGDKLAKPIHLMNYKELKGFKKTLHFTSLIGNTYWQKGAIQLAIKQYNKYIITGDPHCISTWLLLITTKLLNKKTFLWTHGWYGNESPIKKIIKKVFYSLSYKVLLYGDYAKELMLKEGFSIKKLVPIYNSLDYEDQLNVRKQLIKTDIYKIHFSNEFPVIIYIGRIQKSKKIELLLSAIKTLQAKGIKCNLVIIGNEIENIDIRNLITSFDISNNVWIYGSCYDETKLGELIFNANLCVVPGNIGLAVMHSFIYGLPVITHDNFSKHGPEFEAIIEGKTGSFFKEDSIEDLCNKIIPYLYLTLEKREYMRINCYNVIQEKYNPLRQIETLKRILL